jgi:hypothetical protein
MKQEETLLLHGPQKMKLEETLLYVPTKRKLEETLLYVPTDTLYVNTDCWRYWQPYRVGVPWVMSFVLPYTVKSLILLLPVVLIHHLRYLRLLGGFPTSPLHVSLTDVYGLYVLSDFCGCTWMGSIVLGSTTIKQNKHL